MLEKKDIGELLAATETETLDDYRVYRFDQDEFEWDDIYDLGLELDAQVVGTEKGSEMYFLSIKY